MNKSKTNFTEYTACPKQAWYSINGFPKNEISFAGKAIIAQGYEVEELATELFPDIKKSKDFFKEISEPGPVALYQSNITGKDNANFRADIIIKDSDSNIHLFEVKSSTTKKKKHIADIAFQKYVFENNNFTFATVNLICINKEFELNGKINPKDFFQIEDVTVEVDDYLNEESNIANYINEIESENTLARNITSSNCNSCPYHQPCFEGISSAIRNIPRGNMGGKIQKLIDQGINDLSEIPSEFKFSDNQRRYIDIQISNEAEINIPGIDELLTKIQFPLAGKDYETVNTAIPKYDGIHPYEQVPFQYSIHIQDANGSLRHESYLHESKSNPIPDVLKNLSKVMPSEGSIIVWNDTFEKSINNMMAEKYPEYKTFLHSLNERMIDLSIVFQKHYLHPKFMGSYSLKNVLPVFYDQLQYSDLSIPEGQTASFKWLDMIFGNLDAEEKEKIKQDLLAYSKLDTEGMFHIYQSLVNLIN